VNFLDQKNFSALEGILKNTWKVVLQAKPKFIRLNSLAIFIIRGK